MIAALRYIEDPIMRLCPGDTIIVPAVSWSTTYYPLYQYGLNLKFISDPLIYLTGLTTLISGAYYVGAWTRRAGEIESGE